MSDLWDDEGLGAEGDASVDEGDDWDEGEVEEGIGPGLDDGFDDDEEEDWDEGEE